MAYSQSRLHNPLVRPPRGPRTPAYIPASLLPLISTRKGHIVRLYNILTHLLTLAPSPETSVRTVRAWRALASCKEVHLSVLWRTGAAVIERMRVEGGEADDGDDEQRWRARQRAEWLKYCQEGRVDRVDKFNEYILALVAAGRSEFALDELDAYLDNQPYTDSIKLNTLYGLLALLTAQPSNFSAARTQAPSSSDDSDSPSEDEYGLSRKRRNGRSSQPAKRARANESPVGADEDYSILLPAIAAASPNLFSKATERFRRAARLADREARDAKKEEGASEAARWLSLIRRHVDKQSADRNGSP
ncbi:proteophosphoglycan ppg4 [Rhodotorula toruloides]|uniref:Proteophosphoglycan ppg4 n=1 Tax=Rhodotorula toruloides TaxID=5286 RepID=A0A511KL31_RHOTO|nr:proteophosphoglycan ppg4 [Rhodotorula toruloides]